MGINAIMHFFSEAYILKLEQSISYYKFAFYESKLAFKFFVEIFLANRKKCAMIYV